MSAQSFQDPVFATYAIAAVLMILKASAMSWLTVVRMMQKKGWLSFAGGSAQDGVQPRASAYIRASDHETRALFWTVARLCLFVMTCRVLLAALGS